LRPVFVDKSDLTASADLSASLYQQLEASRALIVVCSPEAAESEWVEQEIRHFCLHRTDGMVLSILAPGIAYEKGQNASFLPKPILEQHLKGHEPLVVNTDEDGEQTAFLRLAAGLLGVLYSVPSDRHAERERQIRRQRSRLAAKTHTLPAETAFLRGDTELALKHALSAILEGDDRNWSEAPELE